MKFPLALIATLALTMSLGSPLSAQQKIVFVSPGLEHPYAQYIKTALTEALSTLGFELDLKFYPPSRCWEMLDAGEAGGFLMSDAGILAAHPRLLKVDIVLANDEFVVFTKAKEFEVKGWDSLKPYKVGYMIGMTPVEEGLKTVSGLKSYGAQSINQVFVMLDAGRTDIAVMPRIVSQAVLKGLKTSGIRTLPSPLIKIPLYTILDQSQKNLLSPLTEALRKMEKTGRLKVLLAQVEDSLKN